MAFIDELADKLGLTVGESVGGCKVTVYGRSGVIAEGHRGLYYYDDKAVKVRIKNGVLFIEGEGLNIRSANGQELAVIGHVSCVRMEEGL